MTFLTPMTLPMTRRRALKTLFCSSVLMDLNLGASAFGQAAPVAGSLDEVLGPLLEQHGVHAYFCGHDHDLQHMELENLRTSFVLSGGGGARLYESDEAPRAGSTVLDVHGFTHLSIAGETMTIRHIDPNGKIVHAFTKGVKHDWKILA